MGIGDKIDSYIFKPLRTDNLKKSTIPFINKVVHVRSWYYVERWVCEDNPEGLVGYIYEFGLDLPKQELIPAPVEHNCEICEILDEYSMR